MILAIFETGKKRRNSKLFLIVYVEHAHASFPRPTRFLAPTLHYLIFTVPKFAFIVTSHVPIVDFDVYLHSLPFIVLCMVWKLTVHGHNFHHHAFNVLSLNLTKKKRRCFEDVDLLRQPRVIDGLYIILYFWIIFNGVRKSSPQLILRKSKII